MPPNNALSDGDFELTAVGAVPTGWSTVDGGMSLGGSVAAAQTWTNSRAFHINWSTGLFEGTGTIYFPTLNTGGHPYASMIFANTFNLGFQFSNPQTMGVNIAASVGSPSMVTTGYGHMLAVSAINVVLGGAATEQFRLPVSAHNENQSGDYYMDDVWVVFHDQPLTQAQLNALIAPVNAVYDPSFAYDTLGLAPVRWSAVNGATLTVVSDPLLGTCCQVSFTAANTNPTGVQYVFPWGINSASTSLDLNVTSLPDGSVALQTSGTTVASATTPGRYPFGSVAGINKSISSVALVIPTPVVGHTYTWRFGKAIVSPTPTLPAYLDGDSSGYYWGSAKGNSATLVAAVIPSVFSVRDPMLSRIPGIN